VTRIVAACVLLSACSRAPVRRCDDDLGGVWRGPDGAYHLLDLRGRLELYPTFRDLPADLPAGVVAAPSVIDLTRTAGASPPRGTITRRYERGATFCAVKHPATLLRCADDHLAIELIVPAPPTDWTACADGATAVTTLELTRPR
jgi:hypothetical protein